MGRCGGIEIGGCGAEPADAFIALLHLSVLEQQLIFTPGLRVLSQQHQPGSSAVQPVNGH